MSVLDDLDFTDYYKLIELSDDFRWHAKICKNWADDGGLGPQRCAAIAEQARRALVVAAAIEIFAVAHYPEGEEDDKP